jgi:competence protein ComEC
MDVRQPRRLLVALTVALLVGQLCGSAPYVRLLAGGMAVVALAVWLHGRLRLAWIAACVCLAAIGMLQVDAVLRPRLVAAHIAHAAGRAVSVAARVRDCTQDSNGRVRLLLDVRAIAGDAKAHPAQGRVLVTIATATEAWQPGDGLQATLRLRRPRNFGNPGEFDYEAFLARRQVYVTAFAMTDRTWERTPAARDFRSAIGAWRTAIRAALARTLSGTARDIAAALIIGDTASLPPSLWDRYARTGVVHVLSISGLHIGLVASAAFAAIRWLMSRSQRFLLHANVPKVTMALSVVPVILYGVLAGGSAPTLRSIVMVLVLGVGLLLNRRHDWLTALAAAALVISLLWPGAVFEIAFQLSFMSVLALMIGMPPINRRWRAWEEARLVRLRSDTWRWRAARVVVVTLGATACAAVGTAPLTAYHFHQVSLITLVANLLVVPLLGIVPVSAGLVAAVCVPLAPTLAAMLFWISGLFIHCADTIVTFLAQVPGAAIRTVGPSEIELALLYAGLGIGFLPARRLRIIAVLALGFAASLDAAYWYRERLQRGRLRVTFLSVGQGDCAVIEFPTSAVMVIDGGGLAGSFDVGERVIAPYLWRRKIAHIDALVLSHAERDHYGGLTFLARTFAPSTLWWNGVPGHGEQLQQFWTTLDQHGVPARAVRRGFRRHVDGVEVEVLGPSAADGGSLNDRSLTVRLRYGSSTLLFPGDVETEGERRLVHSSNGGLTATILKVPHHGSRTSSTAPFVDAVMPRVAVISAGFDNRFRMPHAEVLAAYGARGASMWRTDLDGAVIVEAHANGAVTVTGTRSLRTAALAAST